MSRGDRDEKVEQARELYAQGNSYKVISEKLGVPAGTLRRWKSTYKWGDIQVRKDIYPEQIRGEQKEPNNMSEQVSEHNVENVSWITIENEYVTDIRKNPQSLKKLAEKYNVSYDYLRAYAAGHDWKKKRQLYVTNVSQKLVDKQANKDVDRIQRLMEIADTAADKAEQAILELETYLVTNRTTERTIEYKEGGGGKPTPIKEIINEKENLVQVTGPVNCKGLNMVANALKNIKEVYMLSANLKQIEHREEYDKRKLEIELLNMENRYKIDSEPESADDDNFLEALNKQAVEVWREEQE